MRARQNHARVSKPWARVALIVLALAVGLLAGAASEAETGAAGSPASAEPIRVGMARGYAPLAFAEDGKPAGVEADLVELLEPLLGRKLVITQMSLTELIPSLLGKKVDVIMSGLSITEERKKQIRFVDPYLRTGQMALVRKSDLARATEPGAMAKPGVKIGVRKGSTGEAYVRNAFPQAEIVTVESVSDAADDLKEKKIDFFVHDAPAIWRLTGRPETRDDALAGLYQPLTEEYLAWAVRPDDEQLAKELNGALDQLRKNGMLQKVLDQWIPVTKVVVGAPAATPATSY